MLVSAADSFEMLKLESIEFHPCYKRSSPHELLHSVLQHLSITNLKDDRGCDRSLDRLPSLHHSLRHSNVSVNGLPGIPNADL